MIHNEKSQLAEKVMIIKKDVKHPQIENFGGSEILIEDWWDRITGKSWMHNKGNPACIVYALRMFGELPLDDEVLYGKIGHLGHLVHLTELVNI